MKPRLPERQLRINRQFSDELADLKTQMLFVSQAIGSVVGLLDGIVEELIERQMLQADDALVSEYRRGIEEVKRLGLKLEPPEDPEAAVYTVKCPSCQAVIRTGKDTPVERCEWCGHKFQSFE